MKTFSFVISSRTALVVYAVMCVTAAGCAGPMTNSQHSHPIQSDKVNYAFVQTRTSSDVVSAALADAPITAWHESVSDANAAKATRTIRRFARMTGRDGIQIEHIVQQREHAYAISQPIGENKERITFKYIENSEKDRPLRLLSIDTIEEGDAVKYMTPRADQ